MNNNLDFYINELKYIVTRGNNTPITYPIIEFEKLEEINVPTSKLSIMLDYIKLIYNINTKNLYKFENVLKKNLKNLDLQLEMIKEKKAEFEKDKHKTSCEEKEIGSFSFNLKSEKTKIHYIGIAFIFNLVIFIIPMLAIYEIIPKKIAMYSWFALIILLVISILFLYFSDTRTSLKTCKLNLQH